MQEDPYLAYMQNMGMFLLTSVPFCIVCGYIVLAKCILKGIWPNAIQLKH